MCGREVQPTLVPAAPLRGAVQAAGSLNRRLADTIERTTAKTTSARAALDQLSDAIHGPGISVFHANICTYHRGSWLLDP